jgi:tetratricopeptide (TPR) repeat protein
MRQALAAFDEALAVDPAFTSARVQRAMTLLTIANVFPGNDATLEKKTEADALAEAERSVSQAPELAIAHAALASVLEFIRWDFTGAEREYARAMELEPGNSWAASQSWRLLMDLGHYDAAVAMAKRGTELNPLAIGQYVSLAYTLIYTGHPDDALAALQHAEQLGFSGDRDTQLRGLIALRMGEFEKALRICAAEHDWMGNYCLAIGDHSLGKQADADAQLTKLRALLGDNGTVQYADIYAQWGRPDDALHWLETAYRLHDPGLLDMKPDWFLDPIRDTPRYKDIERRMNFPL